MRHVIALVALVTLLLLTVGAVAGVAVMDARRARAQLREERAEYGKALNELNSKLIDIQAQAERLAATKDEAIAAWRLQSRLAQFTESPTWPPPKSCRGIGGPK